MVPDPDPRIRDRALALLQLALPTHALSRLVLAATRVRTHWWKQALIRGLVRLYRIDLSEALDPEPGHYACFNDLFTRALAPGARRQPEDPTTLSSPVDGRISQLGEIRAGRIFQAKGHDYSLEELLGGQDDLAGPLRDGRFATLYLAPHDYHRIHMPSDARLLSTVYIPGRLFSVAPGPVSAIPRLFARNERLVCAFEGERGPWVMVLVGALFVGGIETVHAGPVTPPHRRHLARQDHDPAPRLARGAELGRFNMGSTVILLTPRDAWQWLPALGPGQSLRMGQALGTAIT